MAHPIAYLPAAKEGEKPFLWLFLPLLLGALMISLQPLAGAVANLSGGKDLEKGTSRAAVVDPLDPKWDNTLGLFYMYSGQPLKALVLQQGLVLKNPLEPQYWVELADTLLFIRRPGGLQVVQNASFLDPTNGEYRWKVLITALQKDDVVLASREMKALLLLEPAKRPLIFQLAYTLFQGNLAQVMAKVIPLDEQVMEDFLFYLFNHNKAKEAWTLWQDMELRDWVTDRALKGMVNFLMQNQAYSLAYSIWSRHIAEDEPGVVYNHGFEKELLGYGFGWRWNKVKGVTFDLSYSQHVEGRHSFHLRFDGEHNPGFVTPYQIVYLAEPGNYLLRAFVKTRSITSSEGPYLFVQGQSGSEARGPKLRGDNAWREVLIPFSLSKGDNAVVIGVRRDKSNKLNRFLGGELWIDKVNIERQEENEEERAGGAA